MEPETEEVALPPRYSGLLQLIFADGTIQYDDRIGFPHEFPLTEAELNEVQNAEFQSDLGEAASKYVTMAG